MEKTENNLIKRPPVIVIMGHIDHGKSTLLDYIRKTNIVEKEAGGITQHVSAYEVIHKNKEGKEEKITFLDTPGHEAFNAIRTRGARVADIAVLIVSAEDGVKPQTIEALKCIKMGEIPFIVAINKIDKPNTSIEKIKQNLSENEIYVEGYGGQIPCVPISAKTGQGVPELMDMMLLVAEMEELTGDKNKKATGTIIEGNMDTKKGISGTLIIKDGSLKQGMFVASGGSFAPVRVFEDFSGKKINEASFSSPVKIIGWSSLPVSGLPFETFDTKKEAEEYAEKHKEDSSKNNFQTKCEGDEIMIPIIVKADVSGSLEAIIHEIKKIKSDKVKIIVMQSGVGNISENDVKSVMGNSDAIILGFNTKIDSPAEGLAERNGIKIEIFNIIYKLAEWLEEKIKEKTPKVKVEEVVGKAKILKTFSKNKDKQILGGRVESGIIKIGGSVKILRRESFLGEGKIRELQQQKNKATEVGEGREFGSMIESKIEIAPGDKIEYFTISEK